MPEPVIELARAKINLALHITGRREDGYHLLDSIVAFADVGDRLTFQTCQSPGVSLSFKGEFGPVLREEGHNIIMDAASMLYNYTLRTDLSAHIELEKNLPLASGIGGGSADAAAALRGLIRLWEIHVPEKELSALALKLGADVPVCLQSVAARMSGIGEKLTYLRPFPRHPAVLVNPREPVKTKDAFNSLGLCPGQSGFEQITDVKNLASCRNDLETSATGLVPTIKDVLAKISEQPGSILARMSGSGATCFGLFDSPAAADAAAEKLRSVRPNWWIVATTIG